MPASKNLVGQKFNSLTVIEKVRMYDGRVGWNCMCDCGKTCTRRTGDLTSKNATKTCGNCDGKYHTTLWEFKDDYVIGHVKNGKFFYIDTEDLFKIKDYGLTVNENGYAYVYIDGESIRLNRFLMNPTKEEVVDHINRIPYDNRKSNLRVCTEIENARNNSLFKNNTSGVTGVFWYRKRWCSQITINYKNIHLGQFKNKDDAIKTRLQAEKEYFGEFAPQQHLFEQYSVN